MSVTTPTASQNIYVHAGAPEPIVIQYRAGGSGGTLVPFDSSLKFTYDTGTGDVVLGVGTGITLSEAESVTDARATIQLTVAQSRTIPAGPLTTYEIQRLNGTREEVFLMGLLIGEGGDNPDG